MNRRFPPLLAILAMFLSAGAALAGPADTLLEVAEGHLRRKAWDAALDTYVKAIARDPSNLHAHLGYQEAALASGKDDAVFGRYRAAYEKAPGDARAASLYVRLLAPAKALEILGAIKQPDYFTHLCLARAYRQLGRSGLKAELKQAGLGVPEDPRSLGLVAFEYEDAGDFKAAAGFYERGLKLAPKRIALLAGIGNVERRLGKLDAAIQHLRQAEALDKDDPEVEYFVGLCCYDRGEAQLALRAFRHALQVSKDDVVTMLVSGEARLLEKKPKEAETFFRQAVKKAPRRTDAWRRLGYCLELQARLDPRAAAKNDEALEAYQQVAKLAPFDANCRAQIGWIYIKKGKFDLARKVLTQAADLDPKEATPLFGLGYIQDLKGRWSEAIDAYEKAVKVDPEFAHAWNNMGLDTDLLGKTAKAIKYFEKALEIAPDNAMFALNLGNAYYHAKRFKDAARVFADVVDKAPKEVQGWTGLARSLRALHRYREAAEAYEEAIKRDPEDPGLHLVAGTIYAEQLKNYEKAIHHYERYLVLGGDDPVVQKWIEKLKKKVK